MAMSDQEVVSILNNLTQLCLASEKGFNVAAENVQNRGLKILLKTYAQQRSQFADELQSEVARLGGTPNLGWKPLASIHRGWINIKAGLTIGSESTERVVLVEARRGEGIALRNYERALARELPQETKAIVQHQAEHVRQVAAQVENLATRSPNEDRMVVRLFDSPADAELAVNALQENGLSRDHIELSAISEVTTLYEAKHKARTVLESAWAGAVLGLMGGATLGLIAGASAMALPAMGIVEMQAGTTTLVGTTVVGLLVGLLFGGIMGGLLGVGIAEDDSYRYTASVAQGNILVMVQAPGQLAETANQIMLEINAARQRGPTHSN